MRYIALVFIVVVSVAVVLLTHRSYDDRVPLIGDTYDYQTLAVNLAQKNVFPVSGMLLPDTAYHFQLVLGHPGAYTSEQLHAGAQPYASFYRNPVYPLFCGLVYKVWGVRTSILFSLQLFLLVLMLWTIPFTGKILAGRKGFIAGVIAAVMAFCLMRRFAFEVQSQALVLPYTIGLWWILAKYLRSYDTRSSVIIGIYLGIGLLLKNFFIPVALLVCCYRLWHSLKLSTILLPLVVVITILPYTIYINHQRDASQPSIWITDQGSDVLLASNNDLAKDGDWHPDGYATTPFYQQPDVKTKPTWKQVMMYACEYPRQTLLNLSEKLRLGLLTRWPPVLFMLALAILYLISLLPVPFRKILIPLNGVVVAAAVLFYLFGRDDFYAIQRSVNDLLHHTWLLVLLLPLCYFMLRKLSRHYLSGSHAASWILMVSFLSLTLIFYGSDRIVGMVDFILMFYAALFAIDLTALTTE